MSIFEEIQEIMAKERKTHEIPELDKETIKIIASKIKETRKSKGYSYEEFALRSNVNRNTYFKIERSSETGENFTISTLLKVLRGLDLSLSEFFKDL